MDWDLRFTITKKFEPGKRKQDDMNENSRNGSAIVPCQVKNVSTKHVGGGYVERVGQIPRASDIGCRADERRCELEPFV